MTPAEIAAKLTPAQEWTSRVVSEWTIGHWSGRFSIYQDIVTGRCVLSGGPPDHFGPIYTDTLSEAKAALDGKP